MALIFVDCEAYGGSPLTGRLTEFGAVEMKSRQEFHGVIQATRPDPANPAVPIPANGEMTDEEYWIFANGVFAAFEDWLGIVSPGQRPIFVSDNPAFDFQWINCAFWKLRGANPFGHSGRRISDYYAGLVGNFYETQGWKRWRQTPHDHNPVHDALGNVEAFVKMQEEFKRGRIGKP